jgi:hypothetical protein
MAPRNDLKQAQFFGGDIELETAIVGEQQYVREHDGTWRYADSWVEVPGARDATLTEHFEPKFIVSGNSEVERVVVAASDIAANPDLLAWCIHAGTHITDSEGELAEVIVPVEEWEEHDRIPGAIIAPEHSENEAHRELAEAEREVREADRAQQIAANNRAEVLRRYADEMTRQEARAITGLSVGRIQQLIRSDSLDEIDTVLLEIVALKSRKDMEAIREELEARGLSMSPPDLRERLREFDHRNLIAVSGKGFAITSDGKKALLELLEAAGRGAEVEQE